MTPTTHPLPAEAVAALRGALAGEAILPGDPGYDAARATFNLTVDAHPALVVYPAGAGDMTEAVRFAAAQGLTVALQATGHGVVRPADGALLINTERMTGVAVDPIARTARVEAGAQWGRVLAAAQPHGLAPLLGSSPGVGAVAYTLGGGMGWLARKHGLAVDTARRFEVVTADGRHLTAAADENADLFWGLRGGGTGLAAVTAMEIRLVPVETVYGGFLIYPGELAGDVLRRWRDWTAAAPEEWTTSVKIMNLPDLEFFPPPLRGQTIVNLAGCFCGPVEEGAALIQGWRDWTPPMFDTFRPMPFSEVGSISQDPENPTPGATTGAWLRELDDPAIDTLVRFGTLQVGRVPLIFVEVRHAGGAIRRAGATDPGSAGAFGYRRAEFVMDAVGMIPAPPVRAAIGEYVGRMKAGLAHVLDGVYMNFLEGDEAVARAADAFPPETFARLKALKAAYDPGNRFSHGLAIPVG